MPEFLIYDQRTQRPVATIRDRKVYRNRDGAQIGIVEVGEIFDLDGREDSVGLWLGSHVVRRQVVVQGDDEMPPSFRRLLDAI